MKKSLMALTLSLPLSGVGVFATTPAAADCPPNCDCGLGSAYGMARAAFANKEKGKSPAVESERAGRKCP